MDLRRYSAFTRVYGLHAATEHIAEIDGPYDVERHKSDMRRIRQEIHGVFKWIDRRIEFELNSIQAGPGAGKVRSENVHGHDNARDAAGYLIVGLWYAANKSHIAVTNSSAMESWRALLRLSGVRGGSDSTAIRSLRRGIEIASGNGSRISLFRALGKEGQDALGTNGWRAIKRRGVKNTP